MDELQILLLQAYVGECQARNRYNFYGKVASKAGFEKIAAIFWETEAQEKTHGKNFLRMFKRIQKEKGEPGDVANIDAVMVPNVYADEVNLNLKAAIEGETHEYTELYPHIADVAEKAGYKDMASQIHAIAIAEKHHAERYQKLLDQLDNGTFFKKEEKIMWVCRECGYMHFGTSAPTKCPSCDHPQAFFEKQNEEY